MLVKEAKSLSGAILVTATVAGRLTARAPIRTRRPGVTLFMPVCLRVSAGRCAG